MIAKLEPKVPNGGEHHEIVFAIDEFSNLKLKIDANCYGTHSSGVTMYLSCVKPEDLERFGLDIIGLAREVREKLSKEADGQCKVQTGTRS